MRDICERLFEPDTYAFYKDFRGNYKLSMAEPVLKEQPEEAGPLKSTIFATVAPYYSTPVTKSNYKQIKARVEEDFLNAATSMADALGITLRGYSTNIGGFEFSEGDMAGKKVTELSYTFELENATPEQADLFASLMGDLGYENQEAVISSNYIDESSGQEANAVELSIQVKSSKGVIKALEQAGISDYTIDTTNKTIKILGFDINDTSELKQKLGKLKQILGSNYESSEYNKIQSRYIDRGTRQDIYGRWKKHLDQGQQDGQLHLYITQAEEALRKARGEITPQYEQTASNLHRVSESGGKPEFQAVSKLQEGIDLINRIKEDSEAHITFNEKTHEYFIDGKKADTSVTTLIHGKKDIPELWKVPSSHLGNTVDRFVRAYFMGRDVLNMGIPNLSKEGAEALKEDLDRLKARFDAMFGKGNYHVFTDEIRIAGNYRYVDTKGNTITKTVAGTPDMIIVDGDGNFHIYDMKTKRSNPKRGIADWGQGIKEMYYRQLSMYKAILEASYPEMKGRIKEMKLIRFDLSCPVPNGITNEEGTNIGVVDIKGGLKVEDVGTVRH